MRVALTMPVTAGERKSSLYTLFGRWLEETLLYDSDHRALRKQLLAKARSNRIGAFVERGSIFVAQATVFAMIASTSSILWHRERAAEGMTADISSMRFDLDDEPGSGTVWLNSHFGDSISRLLIYGDDETRPRRALAGQDGGGIFLSSQEILAFVAEKNRVRNGPTSISLASYRSSTHEMKDGDNAISDRPKLYPGMLDIGSDAVEGSVIARPFTEMSPEAKRLANKRLWSMLADGASMIYKPQDNSIIVPK